MTNIFNKALGYQAMGFSVIPVQKNKKPYIAWEKYQKEKAGPDLIKEWWEKWPNANVAIVTGEISGIDVIDIDSQKGMDALDEMLPDSLVTPISRTPREGWHYYHLSRNGLSNAAGFIEGCDFRGNGGYIIAPPSIGENGNPYYWMPDMSIEKTPLAPLPDSIMNVLKDAPPKLQEGNIGFNQGVRDDTIFHVAWGMAKGGMSREEVAQATIQFAKSCNPPFSKKDALIKVKSAFERLENKDRNLTQEIRDWIESTSGEFLTREVFEVLDVPRDQKAQVSKILTRLVSERLIERTGKRSGCFRRPENELTRMDLSNAKIDIVNIKLPFGIHNLVNLMPGNVVVVTGSKDAAKTGFLLNVAAENMDKFNIHYFNSEMGGGELRRRLELFKDVPFEEWKAVNFYERDQNFHDVIVPGKGNINIIDFLEIYEDFWIVKKFIAQIWRKLEGAIAIIGLQKPTGRDMGLGGEGSIEKARLYLALEAGTLKIVSAKNWKGSENPKGKAIKFKIVNGCKLIKVDDWSALD